MKIVDVLGAHVFKDGERLIMQVQCWEIFGCIFGCLCVQKQVRPNKLSGPAGGGGRLFLHCGIRRGEDNDKKQSECIQHSNRINFVACSK